MSSTPQHNVENNYIECKDSQKPLQCLSADWVQKSHTNHAEDEVV